MQNVALREAIAVLPEHCSAAEFTSVASLMDDASPSVVEAITQKVQVWGNALAPALRILAYRSAEKSARVMATELLHILRRNAIVELQYAMMEAIVIGQDIPLESSLVMLSQFGYPETSAEEINELFDTMAIQVHAHFMKNEVHTDLSLLMCLNRVFFEEYQFHAPESTRYYDTDNCYMQSFLKHRIGIPITIATAYMLVAERCGIELHGIGMPAHFIVYHPELNLYIDPFNSGSFLSKDDCRRYIEQSGLDYDEKYMHRSSHVHILLRMFRNLIMCYTKVAENAVQFSPEETLPGTWEKSLLEKYHKRVFDVLMANGMG
jgi:regulator of sirC expression with transglutaminase-like and TPR domain